MTAVDINKTLEDVGETVSDRTVGVHRPASQYSSKEALPGCCSAPETAEMGKGARKLDTRAVEARCMEQ